MSDIHQINLTARTTHDAVQSTDGKATLTTGAINTFYNVEGQEQPGKTTVYFDLVITPPLTEPLPSGTNIALLEAQLDSRPSVRRSEDGRVFATNRLRVHNSGVIKTEFRKGSHKNGVTLTARIGRLTPFTTKNNKPAIGSDLAVTRHYYMDGKPQSHTTWVSAVAWEGYAQRKLSQLPIGSLISIKGKLDSSPSVPPVDSKKGAQNRIIINGVTLITLPKNSGANNAQQAVPTPNYGSEEIPAEYADLKW